jgi:hydroxymethylbilane synthase
MARFVLGHRDGALATRLARTVLTDLAAEWPDLQLVPRTVPGEPDEADDPVLGALTNGQLNLAVVACETLRAPLPDGLALVAVTRRIEPRLALVSKGGGGLDGLPNGATLGIGAVRDLPFLSSGFPGMHAERVGTDVDRALARLAVGELDALVLPASMLIMMDRRDHIRELLEPNVVPPAPGQGSLALLARDDDDLAAEVAYTLQHRPSFDRVRAERAFAAGLPGRAVGALASVNEDGELTLFGAVAIGATTVQADVTGEAREAEDVGSELAKDVAAQLAALG